MGLEAGGERRRDPDSEQAQGQPGSCEADCRAGGCLADRRAGQRLDRLVDAFSEGLRVL